MQSKAIGSNARATSSLHGTTTHCNPLQHTTTHAILHHTQEKQLVAMLDRPVMRMALRQGWMLSTAATAATAENNSSTAQQHVHAQVDLPIEEFFFRLEPAVELLLQQVSVGVLQCVAVCCSVLQCVAVCCSVLQCVAVCCSVL